MKLLLNCVHCLVDDQSTNLVDVDLRDDGFYELTCSKGHRSANLLQNQKYQLLFESGALALLDGHTREAVSGFASALERFLEFYIKVICLEHNIAYEDVENCWKDVKKQSERQLGAFIFLYLLETEQPTQFLKKRVTRIGNESRDIQAFRNDVIHAGYIPTHDEVVQYGEHVFDTIESILGEMGPKSDEHFLHLQTEHLHKRHEANRGNLRELVSITSTILRLPNRGEGKRSFRQELGALRSKLELVK